MMRTGFIVAILFMATACQRTGSPAVNSDSTGQEKPQDLKSLFDTTPEPLRNSAHFHTVEIRQMKFIPEVVNVHKGDTIAWINNDIVIHDITEEKNKEWSSAPLAVGSTWQMVADKSADYFCSIHVVMKGKIVVE